MKNKLYVTALALTVICSIQSCAVVGGIFKAGAATGIVAVVVIIAIVVFILARVFGNKG